MLPYILLTYRKLQDFKTIFFTLFSQLRKNKPKGCQLNLGTGNIISTGTISWLLHGSRVPMLPGLYRGRAGLGGGAVMQLFKVTWRSWGEAQGMWLTFIISNTLQTSVQPKDMFTTLGGTRVCTTKKSGRNIKCHSWRIGYCILVLNLLHLPWFQRSQQTVVKPISLAVLEKLCFSQSTDSQTALKQEACLYTTNILK